MATVKLELEGREIILRECEDLFGCTGVSVYVNNVFRGIEDVFNIEEVQNNIINDINYIDTLYS